MYRLTVMNISAAVSKTSESDRSNLRKFSRYRLAFSWSTANRSSRALMPVSSQALALSAAATFTISLVFHMAQ